MSNLPVDSPSGTLLDHSGQGSNWVRAHELPRVVLAMAKNTMITAEDGMGAVAKQWRVKYVDIRVDMRTGHFVLVDQHGVRIDGNDEVLRALGIQ